MPYNEPKDIVSTLVNIACASIKISKVILKEPEGDFELRPQLHFMLLSDPGNIKSTVLSEVAKIHNISPYASVTYPGLVGSVQSRGGVVIPGAAWESRNKIMLLDEFNPKHEMMIALLRVLEDQQYKRKLGFKSIKVNKRDGDLYFKAKDGVVELKTRIACIIASMMHLEYSLRESTQALVSRCVPFRFIPSIELLSNIARGGKIYKYTNYEIKYTENDKHSITINEDDYMKIVEFIENEKLDKKIFMRSVGDCCRAFAVLSKHDYDLYKLICGLKQRAIQCYNIMFKEKINERRG